MPWMPADTLLTTTDENKNLSFDISYVPEAGAPDPITGEIALVVPAVVTIVAVTANPTISVSGAIISGFYSEAFAYNVRYIDNKLNDYSVKYFSEIDESKLYELYRYTPNMNTSVTYEYVATARDTITNQVLATQTYNIVVTQNWTTNKNLLKRYVNFDDYFAKYGVSLVNSSGTVIPTINNLGSQVYWESRAVKLVNSSGTVIPTINNLGSQVYWESI